MIYKTILILTFNLSGFLVTDLSTDYSHEKLFDFNSNFSAKLKVEDIYGCQDSITYNTTTLSFEDYFSLNSPNVFTPNNDGINDIFEFKLQEECMNVRKFNI